MDCLAQCPRIGNRKSIAFTALTLMLGTLLPHLAADKSVTELEYSSCASPTLSESDTAFAANLDAVSRSLKQKSADHVMYSLASSNLTGGSFVHGMYQCRGDISLSDCSSCVGYALIYWNTSGKLAAICNNSYSYTTLPKRMQQQFKGCYLRYEEYYVGLDYVLGPVGEFGQPVVSSCSFSNESASSPLYEQNVRTAIKKSASAAPQHPLFGYNALSVGSGSNKAYVLTQCYGYLNSSQCATCLSQISNFSVNCNGSYSVEVYYGDCFYLFGKTPLLFTNTDAAAPTIAGPSPAVNLPGEAAPTIAGPSSAERSTNHTALIVGIVVGGFILLSIITTAKWVAHIYKREDPGDQQLQLISKQGATRFSLKELRNATNNFHPHNKLGQGGFGPVYKGRLKCGTEVAIKMLSAHSHQGNAEFVNEVNLITTVQHRNLIQLIGCCMEGSKPLLVYEYLPNRSLNLHLFDVHENDIMDWPTRFEIILGIARGLRYLHEDSHVRIIHRDIKPSNILLDNKLNPKIADFGMARLFADDTNHVTTRVVGTLGYLAPEYAISGQLTEKADVYSFGLVALEIVSGRKVIENRLEENKQNLLDWTWTLFEKQQQVQIVDERMQSNNNESMQVNVEEVTRVVHVALLCTQQRSQGRPSMSEVHNMLCGQLEILKLPIKPFTVGMSDASSTSNPSYNGEPISEIGPR